MRAQGRPSPYPVVASRWPKPVRSRGAPRRSRKGSTSSNGAGRSYPRITYWEPAKRVAKLHATKIGDRLLLLHTNMEAGQ